MIGVPIRQVDTIEEAETYECSKNSLQFVIETFFNQLALAYPNMNIRKMARMIFENVRLNGEELHFAAGGYKMITSLNNVMKGAKYPDELSLVKETQIFNTRNALRYADYIMKKGYRSITILGLSSIRNIKLAEISPAVILGSYLSKQGIRVLVEDPYYSEEEIRMVLPFAERIDLEKKGLSSDVLFLMSDYYKYRYYGQREIDKYKIRNAKLILDNSGMLERFSYSEETEYHCVGDGKLDILVD